MAARGRGQYAQGAAGRRIGMQIGDVSYFAPDVPFEDVDLTGRKLPGQLLRRFEGYYLEPAALLVDRQHAFGAGLLLVSCIDAMSNFAHGPNREERGVRRDFLAFARTRLPSFKSETAAKRLYEDYRNGLVHEARLKAGCFFAVGVGRTLDEQGTFPVIDVARLFDEVRQAIHQVVDEMEGSEAFRGELVRYVGTTFARELQLARRA
jgi:hypothetical protein